MLEYWNSGIMGSGIMQCWINGPATGGIDDKIKMVNILLIRLRRTSVLSEALALPYEPEATIPLFHFRGKFRSPKKLLYSQ
jgi:hypothetical protein